MSDSEEQSGRLLDDEGRLFGLVNIIDVLVVLLIVAVVVAGVALLFPSGGGESETRYVTLDLGSQPDFLAEEISSGDTWDPEQRAGSLTITDVYRFESGLDQTRVIARAEVNGTLLEPDDPTEDPVFQFLGDSLRTGQTYQVVTNEYQVEGSVTRVETSDDTLQTGESEFIMQTTLQSATAGEVSVGDQFRSGGDVIAEITSLETFRGNSPDSDQQYALVGISANTLERGGDQLVGNTRIAVGQSFDFDGQGYTFSGEVLERGTSDIPSEESEFLLETTLQPATADEIDVGDAFIAGGATYGEVSSLEVFPNSGGSSNQYALIGVTINTVERGGSQYIGNTRLTIGESLSLDSTAYTFSGQIRELRTSNVTTELRPLVIQTEVPTTVANDIRSGDEYTLRDNTLVSVESVTVYPTANPDQRRVVLGVSAKTRLDQGNLFFGNRQLRVGSTLPVANDKYAISGEIVRRGSLTEPGTQTSQTVTVLLENVSPERADLIERGMTEQTRSGTTAEVTSVSTEPAQVILESEDGNIYQREHPENKDLELRVELSVRELDSGTLRFRGDTLRAGETLALELGLVTIEGEVIDFQ